MGTGEARKILHQGGCPPGAPDSGRVSPHFSAWWELLPIAQLRGRLPRRSPQFPPETYPAAWLTVARLGLFDVVKMTKRAPVIQYTSEQIAIIERMMVDGSSARTIWAAVSAVPGGRPTINNVSQRTYKIRKPTQPSHQKPEMQAAPAKKAPQPRRATMTFLQQWARDRGITFVGLADLPVINAHAAARGLPAFEVLA